MNALTLLYTHAVASFRTLRDREEGQGLVEYALIIGLVSVALILALQLLTGSISGVFGEIQAALEEA
jgi:pilus assembly protein Flp/PilA